MFREKTYGTEYDRCFCLTTMEVRAIYYFMLFPLISYLFAWLYSELGSRRKTLLLIFVAAMVFAGSIWKLADPLNRIMHRQEDSAYEISDYLTDSGYETVYAMWNHGADIAIASNERLEAAFWEESPYFYYKYLCNPEVFRRNNSKCVYMFIGEEEADLGIQEAAKKDIELTLLQYFPEADAYFYTASESIMEAFW